jgi:hypothetical protein
MKIGYITLHEIMPSMKKEIAYMACFWLYKHLSAIIIIFDTYVYSYHKHGKQTTTNSTN